MEYLSSALSGFAVQLPIILALSLILAIILNQKFHGRMVARAIFFLPVIIATGVIISYLVKAGMVLGDTSGDAAAAYSNMINFDQILGNLGLPEEINELISGYISSVFNLLWSCGVQIILFISGLQSIPDQLYEVAKVEGCSKWEEFWYITFPMLGQNILLVMVYTMIELITAKKNVMASAYDLMSTQTVYDRSSAMLWMYFVIVGLFMAAILAVYNRFCLKKWS
jgi:ABC-type sugar transport system permease subunit